MQNEETNQSLAYSKIATLEVPEDYAEGELPNEDDEDAEPKVRNELVYVAGRLFRDEAMEKRRGGKKWVYESYNKVCTTEKFGDVAVALSKLYKRSQGELQNITDKMFEANKHKIEAAEEKARQAQIAAAQKKGKAKKSSTKADEELVEAMQKTSSQLRSSSISKPEVEEDFDLFNPAEFGRALRSKFGRPFAFGPIEFAGLDSDDFDGS